MNSITDNERKISRTAAKRVSDQIPQMTDEEFESGINPIAEADVFSRVVSMAAMPEDEDEVKGMLLEYGVISKEEHECLSRPDLLQICLAITDSKIRRSPL